MDLTSYENLVTYRHLLKEKYMKFVRLLLEQPLGSASVTDSFLYAFNLFNARGVNLDVIGELVGVNRLLNFTPTVGTRLMNDDEYRMLIRLKIARNVWDGRNESIQEIYDSIFPELNIKYIDNQDMTITITTTGNFRFREYEIFSVSGYLLIPAGVGYKVEIRDESGNVVLYTAVAQYGEQIVDRAVLTGTIPGTWGYLESKKWEDFENLTWEELLHYEE